MTFKTIPCHESLQPFIRNYWLLTCRSTGEGRIHIISNGAASLHFFLTQPVRLDDGERRYQTLLVRQDVKKLDEICEEGELKVLGVEFVPFCSRLFFKPQEELTYPTPQEMEDAAFIALEEQIHAERDEEKQRQLLDDFFLNRLMKVPVNEVNMDRMKDVFEDIVPTHGHRPVMEDGSNLSTADLAETACLSPKQFTRVFSEHVGMNPKAYLRLLRFHKALKELHRATGEHLTEVAWRCGYYDLAHMSNEFRQLCGYSPSEILEMGGQMTEAFQEDFSSKMKKKIVMTNIE